MKKDLGQAEADKEAYLHDENLIAQKRAGRREVEWHRSDAYKLLKEDIKAGKVVGIKPMEVYYSRPEYKEFTLTKF